MEVGCIFNKMQHSISFSWPETFMRLHRVKYNKSQAAWRNILSQDLLGEFAETELLDWVKLIFSLRSTFLPVLTATIC